MPRTIQKIILTATIIPAFCATMLLAFASDAAIYVQRDMKPYLSEGAEFDLDPIDIGQPKNMFDGDLSALIRSDNVNPFNATVVFSKPIEFDRLRLRFTGDVHEWSLEIADNKADLTARTGSYKKLVDNRRTRRGDSSVVLDSKVKAQAFHLTVHRITGDDYVHISEWEFPVEEEVKSLKMLVLDYAPRDDKYREPEKVFTNTVLTLKATASTSGGVTADVTREVEWSVSDSEPWMDSPGRFLLKEPGVRTITAKFGDIEENRKVEVIEPLDYKGSTPSVPFTNDKTDLDVLFIERLPRIDYDAENGGWPEDGSTVTWRAHIRNWGRTRVESLPWKFTINERMVSEGTIDDFEPGTVRTVDWETGWHKSRQRIAFEIDPGSLEELSKFNNRVEDLTDALAVGFYVEEYIWQVVHEHQQYLNLGSNGFEDWAQRQIREWNELHEEAVYPSTPFGVIDRVRLDRVVVVPNNSLPMAGGLATNNPDNRDKTVDLIWGFESNDCHNDTGWRDHRLSSYTNISWGHMHELNHARYLIDSYGFDIHPGQVKILLDDGTPLAGSEYFPRGMLRSNKYRGLMGGGTHVYDEYMALAWNNVTGRRARGGNYNAPTVIGEYLQLHPKKNTFTFIDIEGNPLSEAGILIYRTEGMGQGWYDKNYDNVPDYKLTLDENGEVDLPWEIFSKDGVIRHTYGCANSKVIVRVNHGDKVGFEFIEASDFNMEYMKGNTEHGHYTVKVDNLRVPGSGSSDKAKAHPSQNP